VPLCRSLSPHSPCVISWMFCVLCVVLLQCDCVQVIAFRSNVTQ